MHMFGWFVELLSSFFGALRGGKARILLLGLDNAGKTTILKSLSEVGLALEDTWVDEVHTKVEEIDQ